MCIRDRVDAGQHARTLFARRLQLRQLCRLLLAVAGQGRLALVDLALHRVDTLQLRAEFANPLPLPALQITLVGQGTLGFGDAILRQHRLQRCVATSQLRRTQQPRQFRPLRIQIADILRTFGLQLSE